MLKQPSHITLKTHKTGFHLEMTETVKLRRLHKETKLLCVKAVPKVLWLDKSLLAAASRFIHLVLTGPGTSEVQVGKLRLCRVTILPAYTLHACPATYCPPEALLSSLSR